MKACKHCLYYKTTICSKTTLDICEAWTVRPHSYKLDVICPYCGEENVAATELKFRDGESKMYTCDLCKRRFSVTAHVAITYTTETEWESNIQ